MTTNVDQLRTLLTNLPPLPLSYSAPDGPHDHWAITDATGAVLACPHQAPDPALVAFLTTAPALLHAQDDCPQEVDTTAPGTQPPTPLEAIPHIAPGPTPAAEPTPVPAAAAWMYEHGVSMDEIRSILAAPSYTRPGRNGACAYVGGGWEVVLSEDETAVLAVYPRALAGRSGSGSGGVVKSAGRSRKPVRPYKVTGDMREFEKLLKLHGFVVSSETNRHRRITHPDHPGRYVTVAASPSDWRWAQHAARDVRHEFGVDLRLQPGTN